MINRNTFVSAVLWALFFIAMALTIMVAGYGLAGVYATLTS